MGLNPISASRIEPATPSVSRISKEAVKKIGRNKAKHKLKSGAESQKAVQMVLGNSQEMKKEFRSSFNFFKLNKMYKIFEKQGNKAMADFYQKEMMKFMGPGLQKPPEQEEMVMEEEQEVEREELCTPTPEPWQSTPE